MQRSSFTVQTGLRLAKTPNHRQQIARRRIAVIGAMLALATASGVIGTLSARNAEDASQTGTGPFSYLTE